MTDKTTLPTEPDSYKFVKVNGEYRWGETMFTNHKELVNDGETAEAAGIIFINYDGETWTMSEPYSSTLKIGCGEKEYKEISELLNLQHRDKY